MADVIFIHPNGFRQLDQLGRLTLWRPIKLASQMSGYE